MLVKKLYFRPGPRGRAHWRRIASIGE